MALMSTTGWEKDLRGVLVVIRSTYPTLRAAEQRVADYVLEHPDDVVKMSVTELAQACATSEATVGRFCRALGYRGVPEMKLVLARDLARQENRSEPEGALAVTDGVEEIARRVFQYNFQALVDTMELQQVSALERAVVTLSSASRIALCSMDGANAVALEGAHKLQIIGLPANAYTDAQAQRIAVSLMGPGDAVVVVSHSGDDQWMVGIAELARGRGATVIGMTNFIGSPLSAAADITLYSASAQIGVGGAKVASRLAEIALLDALFVAVTLRRQAESIRALELIAAPGHEIE